MGIKEGCWRYESALGSAAAWARKLDSRSRPWHGRAALTGDSGSESIPSWSAAVSKSRVRRLTLRTKARLGSATRGACPATRRHAVHVSVLACHLHQAVEMAIDVLIEQLNPL